LSKEWFEGAMKKLLSVSPSVSSKKSNLKVTSKGKIKYSSMKKVRLSPLKNIDEKRDCLPIGMTSAMTEFNYWKIGSSVIKVMTNKLKKREENCAERRKNSIRKLPSTVERDRLFSLVMMTRK